MKEGRELHKISSSWGDIVVQLQDGKVVGCTLPYLEEEPSVAFAISSRSNHPINKFIFDTFRGRRVSVPPIGKLPGSAFQKEVWKALTGIAAGETKSYGEIAAALGKPQAYRAVANACGRNPVPIFIPCHRVIGSDGKLHGFSSGTPWKRLLLGIEAGCRI